MTRLTTLITNRCNVCKQCLSLVHTHFKQESFSTSSDSQQNLDAYCWRYSFIHS